MSGETEGWSLEEPFITPGGMYRFDYWTKNISTPCSGICFRITRIISNGLEQYELGIVDAWCPVATRPTLRECQILAHATARLWAGEKE